MIRRSKDSGLRIQTLLVVLAALVALTGLGSATPVAAAPPGLTFVQARYIIDTPSGVSFDSAQVIGSRSWSPSIILITTSTAPVPRSWSTTAG